jgi:uncharacterized membrane protein YbhN (UPF0104 family)
MDARSERPTVGPGEPPALGGSPAGRVLLRAVLGALLLGFLAVLVRRFLDLQEFLATLSAFERAYLVPILLLALSYYLLKALRWHYYLTLVGVRVSLRRSASAYLAGQWFTFTPGGELVRAYLLGAGAAFAPIAATVIVQALLDFASLALVATVAVGFYPVLAPVVLPVTLPLLGTMALLATPPLREWLAAGPLTRWLKRRGRWEVLGSAFQLLGPRPTAVGLLLGVPTVLVGGLALYLAGVAIRLPRWDVVQAEGVYALSQLLGGISPLPQGLGVTEASGTALLGYLGLDPAEALAAVVLYRAAVLGFSALLGLLGFLQLRWGRDPRR